MGKLATFAELDGEERKAAFEAATALLSARILVAFVPLRYWRDRFKPTARAPLDRDISDDDAKAIALVRRSIKRAMRNAPLDFICLPQALAARWMLERRGIASELRIGALRKREDSRALHAWLRAGGDFVTGDCNLADYAVLGREDAT